MASLFRGTVRPVLDFVRRMRRSFAFMIAMAVLGTPALERAGMLEMKDERRGILEVSYLVGWWLIAVLAATAPTYAGEPLFYFPAILALSVAWLVTMPSFGQVVVATDFSVVRPPKGIWARFLDELQKRRVKVPPELMTEESKATIDAIAPPAFPIVVPVVLLQWLRWIGLRAVYVAVVGMAGLLIGPILANVHWWRGWTPVSLLYGMTAPWVLLLLITLLIPALTQGLVAGLQADRDLQKVFNKAS